MWKTSIIYLLLHVITRHWDTKTLFCACYLNLIWHKSLSADWCVAFSRCFALVVYVESKSCELDLIRQISRNWSRLEDYPYDGRKVVEPRLIIWIKGEKESAKVDSCMYELDHRAHVQVLVCAVRRQSRRVTSIWKIHPFKIGSWWQEAYYYVCTTLM